MADKKNIVIKVKYSGHEKPSPTNTVASPQYITEWNVKRIVITIVVIVSVLTIFYLISTQKSATQNTELAEPVTPAPSVAPLAAQHQPKLDVSHHVTRSVLAYKIVDNEPVDEIKLPVKISKKGSTWIYYFVEINSMKGKTVFHEWVLNGFLISRKKVNIDDDTWRTSSRQVFKFTTEKNWTVRLVDEAGGIIDEKNFNVLYE
ncbi:MAG: DUF2914 domain-containing protein [Methylococcaceae bacterium]|nr:DUF2914 domain-containing protein [Methylococcaceae bacterium]